MYIPDNLGYLRTKFFEKQSTFQNFANITEEDLVTLKAAAKSFTANFSLPNYLYSKAFLYERVLRKVTTYQNNPYYHDFDKQIIFVIYALDPDLLIYKIYLASPSITKEDSNHQNDCEEKLLKCVGLTDKLLLKYEEIFFKHFLKDQALVKGVKRNIIPHLIKYSHLVANFDYISEEQFTALSKTATKWLDENIYDDIQTKINTALYNIINQPKLLGISDIQEQLCLFILLIDPELEMLRIYEDESRLPNIKSRIIEAFSFYHQDLIRLEKIYHQKFAADLFVSPWLP